MELSALPDAAFWTGRRVLITGHTGFKGSWLGLWLDALGAEVHGLALDPPSSPSLFDAAGLADRFASDTRADIRDPDAVAAVVRQARPEVVVHLAAQSLVRRSYREPIETFATNAMGTVNVLEALRGSESTRAMIGVTTDKVYENDGRVAGYTEEDPLGGHDPYSASKSAAEIVIASYRRSFLAERGVAVATARAGNVIGGGDWAAERLVPDALRAFEAGEPLMVRNPDSVRPWQHVLEPLAGYLVLAQRLWEGGEAYAEAWNFGPDPAGLAAVRTVVGRLAEIWGDGAVWHSEAGDHPHEAELLALDASKSKRRLGWRPRWSLDAALAAIIEWERGRLAGRPVRELCLDQITAFASS